MATTTLLVAEGKNPSLPWATAWFLKKKNKVTKDKNLKKSKKVNNDKNDNLVIEDKKVSLLPGVGPAPLPLDLPDQVQLHLRTFNIQLSNIPRK